MSGAAIVSIVKERTATTNRCNLLHKCFSIELFAMMPLAHPQHFSCAQEELSELPLPKLALLEQLGNSQEDNGCHPVIIVIRQNHIQGFFSFFCLFFLFLALLHGVCMHKS